MGEPRPRIVDNEEPPEAEARGVSRRRMMQRLLGSAGAGLVLPGVAAAHPVSRHVMNGPAMATAEARAADPAWKPIFLDPHQNETLIALAERIIPNSTQAQVNRFVDALISVDALENQKKFLASLGAFEHEAIVRYNHPFKDLSEEQQNAILTQASTAEPSQPATGGRRRRRAAVPKGGGAQLPLTLRDHFDNLKGWISGSFYSSEFGMKELGWTGQVAWEKLPGCAGPDGHQ